LLSLDRLVAVTMFSTMLERDRKRCGLRLARAAWLLGVSIRKLREFEPSLGWLAEEVAHLGFPKRLPSGPPPQLVYDQGGSIQGGVDEGLAEGFRLSVLGRGYHFCGAGNGASMVLG